MNDHKKITVDLSEEEAQFLHDFLGNVVIGHPTTTSRRHSDSIIFKLEDKGVRYDDENQLYLKINKVTFIEFIA